jgi:hypothetical protein
MVFDALSNVNTTGEHTELDLCGHATGFADKGPAKGAKEISQKMKFPEAVVFLPKSSYPGER